MKTIISGSRNGILYMDVVEAMENCGWTPTEVVSGAARGVDTLGDLWAKRTNIKIKQFIPDWKTHKKAGGILRNEDMGNYADALVCVWDGQSRGSKHMIDYATGKGLKVYVHRVNTNTYDNPDYSK
jgi:hypothetical protein